MKRNFLLTSFLALLTLVSFAGNKKNSAVFAVLATPTNVVAVQPVVSNTLEQKINITWDQSGVGPTAPVSYSVRVTDGVTGVNATLITGVLTKSTSILVGDPIYPLVAGRTYTFEVMAIGDGTINTNSVWSAPSASITYLPQLTNSTDLGIVENQVTSSAVGLTWHDGNADESGYIVTVMGAGIAPYDVKVLKSESVSGAGNQYFKTIISLNAKTFYQFQVKPFRDAGAGEFYGGSSNIASKITKVLPAAAPVVSFTNNCPAFVGVAWTVDRQEDITSFVVQRSYDNAGFQNVYTARANENLTHDNDVQAGKTMWYRVIAFNESSPNGVISAPAKIEVIPYTAPPVPENVRSDKALKTTTSLTIKWTNPNTDAGCLSNTRQSNYLLYKLSTETEYKTFAILNATANSAVITGLKPKDIVDFRVFALSDRGLHSGQAGGRDTTLGPPYAPSGLLATSGLDALKNTVTNLTWEDNARDEYLFAVESSSDNVTFKEIGRRAFNIDFALVKYIHTPVEEGVRYYYRVRSINDFGISDPSPVLSHIPDYTIAPAAPYGLKARLVSGKVVLTWYDDSYREENIVVEKSSDNGTTYVSIATLGRNILTFTDENVAANASYKYRVKAVNPKGSSPYSKIADLKAGATVSTSSVLSNESVSLYPNPTADFVNIKIPSDLVGKTGKVLILDKSNRVVLDKNFNFDSAELNIDIKNYTEGVYNVIISSGNSKVSKKVYKY